MSAPDEREFAQLAMGHMNRDLTAAEEERLRVLCADHPPRAEEVAGIDELHALFDAERDLRMRTSRPEQPQEAADEGYRRLQAEGQRAEEELRARLQFGTGLPVAGSGRPALRRPWVWAAAAAILLGSILLFGELSGRGAPGLIDRVPDDRVLGAPARIQMVPELTAEQPVLTWHAVLGARRYDARIRGGEQELLQRPEASGSSLRWQLSPEEFALLRERAATGESLFLCIEGRDSAGTLVASSGDLPLQLR